MSYTHELTRNYSSIRARLMGPPKIVPGPAPEPPPCQKTTEAKASLRPMWLYGPTYGFRECTGELLQLTPRAISIQEIQKAVCRFYQIRRLDLISNRRTANLVRPRQVAMFLCKTLTCNSYPSIGRMFGGRDHTTILHGYRKIDRLRWSDGDVAFALEQLTKQLRDSHGHDDELAMRAIGDSDQAACPGEV